AVAPVAVPLVEDAVQLRAAMRVAMKPQPVRRQFQLRAQPLSCDRLGNAPPRQRKPGPAWRIGFGHGASGIGGMTGTQRKLTNGERPCRKIERMSAVFHSNEKRSVAAGASPLAVGVPGRTIAFDARGPVTLARFMAEVHGVAAAL